MTNPKLADLVPVSKDHVICRSSGIAPTARGEARPLAAELAAFLQPKEGAAILARRGWMTPGR